ncbi:MAG: hypothetical protein EOO20_28440 [Chryseobacterium sp.]|nr:MAG: hypothetical protein EOO20_28440 [Chryseobacterium sp.]
MLLGYELSGSDAREKMLGDEAEYAPPHPCNLYRTIYEINFLPDNFKIPKRKNDFYSSADGFKLVSEKVKAFCIWHKYKGLTFVPLPNTNYYWLKTKNVIEYDQSNKYITRTEYSRKCKGYREITCPTPVFLKKKKPLGDNFYRTDLCFGSDGRFPIMCIGIETAARLKKANFTGLYLREIKDSYDQKELPNYKLFKQMRDDADFSFLDLIGYKGKRKE